MRALICGVSGQDGAYLARLLLDKGYEVVGTSRDAAVSAFSGLHHLGIAARVKTVSMAVNDFRSVLATIKKVAPDEIYNLAGQSSVGLSFEQPVETVESIIGGTLSLLEAIRFVDAPVRFYNAGSGECYGDTGDQPATETSALRPRSPYAAAKASAYDMVAVYRQAYGLFACTGMLFNHESPLRPDRFVTQKIVKAAARIAAGSSEKLQLGDIDIERDWGWAPEYVEAMWAMLRLPTPEDFVIATGRSVSLAYFVARVFEFFSLDWSAHVERNTQLLRPADISSGKANPAKARELLGWQARKTVDDVVVGMCSAVSSR